MKVVIQCYQKTFQFGFKARTSRGLMRDKPSWFIALKEPATGKTGIGEFGPLPGLSPDFFPNPWPEIRPLLQQFPEHWPEELSAGLELIHSAIPRHFPGLQFALETAWLDLFQGGKHLIFQSPFLEGKPMRINGLIWMGTLDFMMDQIHTKVSSGFRCLKLKVGGLDFERECDVLRYIRKRYFREDLEIRLDANGAFKPDDVMFKLTELAAFGIHSIEQPLKPGSPHLAELCRQSPIPIALDEELIGRDREQIPEFLSQIKPTYLILKPTLLGGFSSCRQWIHHAEAQGIGWWLTSALESAVGLNAIAQFAGTFPLTMPQGLGTGKIFTNNFPAPLEVKGEELSYTAQDWDLSTLEPVSE